MNPSVLDLLAGVADGLDAEVVPALEPGPALDQVRAAAAIVRRVARALPSLVPVLVADIDDLRRTLPQLGVDPSPVPPVDPAADGLDRLLDAHRALQQLLADRLADHRVAPAQATVVAALLGRSNERRASLRLSPWER